MIQLSAPYTLTYKPHGSEANAPFCLHLTLQKETILKAKVDVRNGYQGIEKQLETLDLLSSRDVLIRLCRPHMFSRETAFMRGIERLLNLTPSEEVQHLRLLFLEYERFIEQLKTLQNIANAAQIRWVVRKIQHFRKIFNKNGATLFQTSLWPKLIPGGFDFPDPWDPETLSDWLKNQRNVLEHAFPSVFRNLELFLFRFPLFRYQTEKKGVISSEMAKTFALSGPIAWASGVHLEQRFQKGLPYHSLENYSDLFKNCPLFGDVFCRTQQNFLDILESFVFISQISQRIEETLRSLPKDEGKRRLLGPWNAFFSAHYAVKNVVSFVETANGDVGFFMISHGDSTLYRCKMTTDSFKIAQILEPLLEGAKITDLALILASLPIVSKEFIR